MFANTRESGASRLPPRSKRGGCVTCAAILACLLSLDAAAQTCPAADPNQNYDCPVGPIYTLPDWGNVPWSLPEYATTIAAGDLDGDGRDELIGRGALGVHVWSFNSTLGVWHPWVRTDGKGLLVLPFSDVARWNQPQYGSTIKLITLASHAGKVLAARSTNGLVIYELTRGRLPGVDLPAGAWTQLASSGPFADGDCFTSNNKCWNAAPYYQTILFGDIDGQPGDEVTAWGADGGVAFKWNGTTWAGLTGFPGAIDAAKFDPAIYSTRQLADVDGEPGQELLSWDLAGVRTHKYVPGPNGGAWRELPLLSAFGTPNVPCLMHDGSTVPSCWATLQTASLGSGGAAVFMRIPGCNANGGGMSGARYNPATQAWQVFLVGGPFDDCSGATQPQYYQTIQFGRITGNPLPELLGRGPGGILVYRWNGTSFVPLSTNVPALADSTWALDPSYWQSIRTANADGSGRAALIARGQTGVRTWLWQGGSLARPLPYGGYPPFTGAEATAFTALNQFLGLAQGTIRDTYTNPGVDNTSSTLRGYVSQIVNARNGCQTEVSANPPQYRTCNPLVGTTNPAYTTMVNQIIKELWFAASVVDRYTTIQAMQNQLFTVEGTEFPSIASNLQLPQGASGSALVNYLTLFANVASLIGDATEVPQINAGADAINIVLSVLPFFNEPPGTVFQETYASIQGQIASLQQAAQANNLAQKHFVLSDYALLSSVGQLVASQAWTIDEAGYLSASRQAFTTWVYQGFLVNLWSFYEVVGCGLSEDSYILCYPPPNGGNVQYYQTFDDRNGTYVNFNGILPNANSICAESCPDPPNCTKTCVFPTPSATTLNVLTEPVSAQCTYNPQAGTAWVYANPNATPPIAGCTLGATPAAFVWPFPVVPINTGWSTMAIDKDSRVTDIGGDARIRLGGTVRSIGPRLNLGAVTLTVHRLLDESRFAGELVKDVSGAALVPMTLRSSPPTARGRKATFATPPGSSPHLEVDVLIVPRTGELRFDLEGDALRIIEPLLCLGTPPTTKLHINLELSGGGLPAPRMLAQVQDWVCVFDEAGRLSALRATQNGAYSVAPR